MSPSALVAAAALAAPFEFWTDRKVFHGMLTALMASTRYWRGMS